MIAVNRNVKISSENGFKSSYSLLTSFSSSHIEIRENLKALCDYHGLKP
ncbi:MAG: hypothetical protein QW563_01420 [Candidatus Methanomethylicia archaeon]